MEKRVRIKDIARQAGVSPGTVDRVLHERGYVSVSARDSVNRALEEMGYQRNLLASALAYNRIHRIVALLPDFTKDPYWEQPYAGVQSAARSVQHYGVQVESHFFDLFDAADFVAKAQAILENPPEAVLFPPLFLHEGQWFLSACQEQNIPTVTFNTQIQDVPCLCYIGQDSYQSGILAARLLNFALGDHPTVMILNLDISIMNARHILEKERGFRDYFAANRLTAIDIVRCDFENFSNRDELQTFITRQIAQLPNLAGIFVSNSRAYQLVECLDAAVLNRIHIVGFDLIAPNIDYLNRNEITFLINQNSVEQGYLSVMTLFKHLFHRRDLIEPIHFLPLDIVVSENVQYYLKRQQSFLEVV